MTTYEKIREIRNKYFPPKLEFGVDIKTNGDNTGIYAGILGVTVQKHMVSSGQSLSLINRGRKPRQDEILGTPVSLQDMLVMLKGKNVSIDCEGFIFKVIPFDDNQTQDAGYNSELKKCPLEISDICQLDLTKSIQNQDEKTLLVLLGLIK